VKKNCRKSIDVILVEDSAPIRNVLRNVLRPNDDIKVVAEVANANSALKRIEKGFEGVVVLDINTPKLNGIQAIRQIKRSQPKLPVIVLSFQSDIRYLQESFKAGASGFILKERANEDLPEAIRKAAKEINFISIDLVP
jgi:DNA-binding NarL/FixJ family response regulator